MFNKILQQRRQVWEQYSKLIKNAGWIAALNLARQILSLIFLAVLVRHVSQVQVGFYQLIVSAVGIAGVFTLSGMGSAIVQSVSRGFLGTFPHALRIRFYMSFLGSIALILYSFTHTTTEDTTMRFGLMVSAIFFPFSYGLAGWTDFQSGQGKFRANAQFQGLVYLLYYSGMIFALLFFSASIVWLIAISNCALAISNIVILSKILREIPSVCESENDSLTYGIRTSIYSAVNLVGNYIDKILIFYFLSPEVLAIYVIAERIPEIVKKYLQSMRVVLIPGFSRKQKYTASLNRKINLISLAVCLIVIFLIFGVVPWLIPIVFTNDYESSVLYCQLLLGTVIIGQVAQTKMAFVVSRLDSSAVRYITLGSNLIRIISSLILVPIFGVYGAVGSTALYRVSTATMVSSIMHRYRSAQITDQ